MHPVRAVAVAAAIAAVPLLGQQRAGWQLKEVAASRTTGGCFGQAMISADSRTMLTVGELGDAVLWDLPTGTLRQRFGPASKDVSYAWHSGRLVGMHPREPWAILWTGLGRTEYSRLDFDTGRYHPMWLTETVRALAFDASGTRVAVVSDSDDRGYRLSIYAATALLSERRSPPNFASDIDGSASGHWVRVSFHPIEPAVFVFEATKSWRVPLDGGAIGGGPDFLQGFLSDGSPILSKSRATCAGMHWTQRAQDTIERGGRDVYRWNARGRDWLNPVAAADGTIVVPDGQGALEMLGPRPDLRRTLRGHCGPVLHMCFDATSRWLAFACTGAVGVLDVSTGTTRQVEGTLAVQPAPGEAAFLLLTSRGVDRIDAATLERSTAAVLPAEWEARTFAPFYHRWQRSLPWLWQPKLGYLWLSCALHGQRWDPVRVVHGVPGQLPEPKRGPHEHTGQRPIEILATPDGGVVIAASMVPTVFSCGTGTMHLTHSSSLSRFDDKGQLVCSTALEKVIGWMRMSPRATLLAVPVSAGVQLFDGRDLRSIRTISAGMAPGVVGFEFVDEDTALSSDSWGLFVLDLTSRRPERLPLPELPRPIRGLCLSPDGTLVALACGTEVRVLRRQ